MKNLELKSEVSGIFYCNSAAGIIVKIKYISYLTDKYGNNWKYNSEEI